MASKISQRTNSCIWATPCVVGAFFPIETVAGESSYVAIPIGSSGQDSTYGVFGYDINNAGQLVGMDTT